MERTVLCVPLPPWLQHRSQSQSWAGRRENTGGQLQPHEGKYRRTITFLSQESTISKYADLTSKVFRAKPGAEAAIRGPRTVSRQEAELQCSGGHRKSEASRGKTQSFLNSGPFSGERATFHQPGSSAA